MQYFRALLRRVFIVMLIILPGMLQSTPVQAAALLDAAPEGVLMQQERQTQTQAMLPAQGNQLHSASYVIPSLKKLPPETPCFVIHSEHLSGARAWQFYWLNGYALPLIGQCVGPRALAKTAEVLDAELVAMGYTTSRVSFPPQNLSSGDLDIHIDVGTVSSVRMVRADNGKPDTDWGTWRNAFAVSDGDTLNVRDLEQGIETMDALSSQSVHTLLEPGATPGSSVVVIQRQSTPWRQRIHGGVTLDNSGSEYVGRPQLSTAASLENPAGLNDILSMNASSNLEHATTAHRSQSLGVNYSLPWDYNAFTFSDNYVRYAQIVQGTTAQFLSSGTNHTVKIQWDRTIWRSASTKFGIFASLFTEQAASYLNDVEVVVQQLNTVNFDRGISVDTKLSAGGEITARIDYRMGLASNGAQNDLPTATTGGLTVRPDIWGMIANWRQPFTLDKQPYVFTSTFHGQATRDTLISEDQIFIGDRYSVRGFDGNTVLMAESGYTLRNELSHPVSLMFGWQSAVYLGIDAGRVWGPSAVNLVGTELAGAVVGVRGQQADIQYDLAMGTPLYHPAGFDSGRFNAYLSITKIF